MRGLGIGAAPGAVQDALVDVMRYEAWGYSLAAGLAACGVGLAWRRGLVGPSVGWSVAWGLLLVFASLGMRHVALLAAWSSAAVDPLPLGSQVGVTGASVLLVLGLVSAVRSLPRDRRAWRLDLGAALVWGAVLVPLMVLGALNTSSIAALAPITRSVATP